MHYIYQTKKTQEILYLKGMQIGVILLGLEMVTSFSYCPIYLPLHTRVPQGPNVTQKLFQILDITNI